MLGARKLIAVAGLAALGTLVVAYNSPSPHGTWNRFAISMWLFLLPISAAVVGVLKEAAWGRWMALATAFAVLPWALLITAAPLGLSRGPQEVALVASLAILAAMSGRAVLERYEGSSADLDDGAKKLALVRWTIVCALAALPMLFLFVSAYEHRIDWHVLIPGGLLLALVLGAILLARGKTAGILVVGASCTSLVPALGWVMTRQASHAGEVLLLALAFFPVLIVGLSCLAAFGKPIWHYLGRG